MTDITKRLAEALRDVIHDSEKGQVPGDDDLQVLREFLDRAAAPEANVANMCGSAGGQFIYIIEARHAKALAEPSAAGGEKEGS